MCAPDLWVTAGVRRAQTQVKVGAENSDAYSAQEEFPQECIELVHIMISDRLEN